MRVFAGHLDDLLGVTVGWQDFALLRFSSGTTTGGDVTAPDRAVATLAGTFGSYVDSPDNGGLFSLQVSAVDDALNRIVIDAYGIDGSFSSGTYHVIAYGEQSILVGASGTSHYGALIADGAYPLLGYLLYSLSAVDLGPGPGTVMSYSADGRYGAGADLAPEVAARTMTARRTGTAVLPLLKSQAAIVLTNGDPTTGDGGAAGPGIRDALALAERIRFIDGTLAYGPDTPEAAVARLYQAAFARAPDGGGLAYWAAALQGGAALADLACGFVASAEFQARYGDLDDRALVSDLSRNLPAYTQPANAQPSGALTGAPVSRGQLLADLSESAANRAGTAALVAQGLWSPDENAASVARLYYTALDRAPDAAGLAYWTRRVAEDGATLRQATDLLVGSAEFAGHWGSLDNSGFVDLLYRDGLGRAADPSGRAAWTGQLAHGGSRSGVVLSFSECAEVRARLAPVTEQTGILVA